MAFARNVKKRIKSVKNTSQITRAMEAVSATKMRRAQEFALNARPYAVASLEMLHNLLHRTPVLPTLMQNREVKNSALLVISSDKGLAGSFNANVLKQAEKWVAERQTEEKPFALIAVGKKAKDYFERRNVPLAKSFVGFGDLSLLGETMEVSDEILNGFLQNKFDEVRGIYTHFRTTLRQEVFLRKILPVEEEGIKEIVRGIYPEHGRYAQTSNVDESIYDFEYKFEPSAEKILNELVPQLIRIKIHHLILESNASEHSARMVAMKNASENASELIDDLSLIYNKARQAGITRELTEITAGADALS